MVIDQDRLEERITEYMRAFQRLIKAVQKPKDEFLRDSVIQRFEFTYELAWKMLKVRLEVEAVVARTPRETLQEALQAGFIEDGNAWSELQKKRNLTSHTYDEELAEEVYAFVAGQGMRLFAQLAEKAAEWRRTV
jgi:nucleotidyltransferase substrate binding protein (TIGR01987 family)